MDSYFVSNLAHPHPLTVCHLFSIDLFSVYDVKSMHAIHRIAITVHFIYYRVLNSGTPEENQTIFLCGWSSVYIYVELLL